MLNVGRKDRPKDLVTQDQIPYPFPADTTKTYTFTPGTGWVVAAGGNPPLLNVQDQKGWGASGGTSDNSAWLPRSLNTILTNQIPGASVASDQVTLPAGTYYAEGSSSFYTVGMVRTRLYSVTDASIVLLSMTERTSAGTSVDTSFFGQFTISSSKSLRIEYRCSTSVASGLGAASSFEATAPEIYSSLRIWKLS